MNDITIHNIKEHRAGFSITDQLERIWLASAIQEGIKQAEAGDTIVADDAFFDGLNNRIINMEGCAADAQELRLCRIRMRR